ncbi:acyltransferase family protein, partial [Hyphomicrobium sp.]|uniref:acyltransferase family protein n=1 Tax=Hyphomicrobium sp. TaxID=82 RepID=UPI000F99ADBE
MAWDETVQGLFHSEPVASVPRSLPASNSLLKRRHDIDALRVIALGLLIIYHTLLVFEPIGWRVTSDHAGRWAILLAETMTPWRLEVIFAIGGIAAAFLLSSRSVSSFLSTRSQRLLIPFVFGVIVLVPPQIYVHLLHNGEVTSRY